MNNTEIIEYLERIKNDYLIMSSNEVTPEPEYFAIEEAIKILDSKSFTNANDLIGVASEFSKWLEEIAHKFHTDTETIQDIIKQFLM